MTTNWTMEVEIDAPDGSPITVEVDVTYHYDQGYWYDSNGEGCPPTSDMDYSIKNVYDYEGNVIKEPEGLDTALIEELIWEFIENENL